MEIIKILHLEDDPADSELIAQLLKSKGFCIDLIRVETRPDFLSAVNAFRPDIILSDYFLAGFLGPEALDLALHAAPGIPFIFVSGKMGEDLAVECLKQGALDYVMKNSLSRLPNALKRSLEESRNQQEKKRALEELKESRAQLATLLESSPDAIWSVDNRFRIKAFNPAAAETIRLSGGRAPIAGESLSDFFPDDVFLQWKSWLGRALRGESFRIEQAISRSGLETHFEVSLNPIRFGEAVAGAVVLSRDITERKAAEREILRQRDELAKVNSALVESLAASTENKVVSG